MPKIILKKPRTTPSQPNNAASSPPAAAPHPQKAMVYFSASELALRWGMSVRHVRRLIGSGELATCHFGRSVRVSLATVLLYEARCTAAA